MVPRLPAPLPGKVARITVVGSIHVPNADILARLNRKSSRSPARTDSTDASALVNVAAVREMGLFQSVQVTGTPDPAGGTDITCTVLENPIVQAIRFTANTPDGQPTVPADTLIAQMHTAVGEVLNINTLAFDVSSLCDHDTGFLRSLGYICDVRKKININLKTGIVTIPLLEAYIGTVEVQGIGSIPQENVLTVLGISPGDLFDIKSIGQGLRRLRQTHQFAEVGPFHYTLVEPEEIAVTILVRLSRSPFGTLAAAPQKSATVSYGGPVGGFVIVPVRVNDRLTGHFLLGTNIDLSELSSPFAVRLGLTSQAMLVDGQPYFIGGQEAASVALDRITLGGTSGVDVQSLSLPVVDLSEISKRIGQTIDGILGADLLSRLTVGIDFPRRRVTFWNHGSLSDAERSAAGFGGAEMPASPASATLPVPSIAAQLQNGLQTKTVSLIVATGNQTSLLPAADFQALGMEPLSSPDNALAVQSRAARLQFGGLSVGTPLFQRNEGDDGTTLGMNVLDHYRMLLDGPAHTARFMPEVTVAGGDPRRPSWVVPFRFNPLTTPYPIVQVSIDGHPPLPFLFDTGTNVPLAIDQKTARTLGLTIDELPAGTANEFLSAQTAPVATAVLQGRTPADSVIVSLEQAAVLDLSALQQGILEPHIAGIIGSGMLQATAVRFDFANRLLTFFPMPDSSLGPPGAPAVPGTRVLPLSEGLSEGVYLAAFTPLSGPPVQLLVDSGSDGSILPYEMRAQMQPVHSAIDLHAMLGAMELGQDLVLSRSPFTEIKAGNLSVSVAFTRDALVPATLGMDILSHSVATLDIPHMQLVLATPPKPPSATYSGWTGMRLAREGNRFRIAQALPDSPAAHAGLKAGDILLAVDGHPLPGLSLFKARTLADGLAGTPAAFRIRRANGPPQTVRFRRADVSHDPSSPLNGVYGQRRGTDPFQIEAVVPGCPADRAGLTAGDAITEIDGHATASLTVGQWQSLLLLTRLTLTISHEGTPRKVFLIGTSA